MFWNVEGGGFFLFTQRMNTRTPTSTVVFFSLISNDIWREGVVCWQKKSSYVYIFLNLIKLLVLITNNQ